MGQLKQGATYIYERDQGTVYAREHGAAPETRQAIGWDYDPRTSDGRPLCDHIQDSRMWGEIHRMAKTNPTLQHALDRVIMLYKLSKETV